MAPVIRALGRRSDRIRTTVAVTGQHRQMLDQVLDLFGIRPDYDLGLMRPDQTLSNLTSSLFTGLDGLIREVCPDGFRAGTRQQLSWRSWSPSTSGSGFATSRRG